MASSFRAGVDRMGLALVSKTSLGWNELPISEIDHTGV